MGNLWLNLTPRRIVARRVTTGKSWFEQRLFSRVGAVSRPSHSSPDPLHFHDFRGSFRCRRFHTDLLTEV